MYIYIYICFALPLLASRSASSELAGGATSPVKPTRPFPSLPPRARRKSWPFSPGGVSNMQRVVCVSVSFAQPDKKQEGESRHVDVAAATRLFLYESSN